MEESKKYPGYYQTEVPELLISYDDEVINQVTGERWEPYVAPVGYYVTGKYYLHRLKASAFVPKPQTTEFLYVNHKDGDKLNNEPDNLEWCTASENCLHAYITGLRTDNIPLLVKDILDGTIQGYYSLSECARALNENPGTISKYINGGRIAPFKNRYAIIRSTEEWPEFNVSDLAKVEVGVARAIVVTDIETGTSKIFPSCADVGRELGYKKATVYAHLTQRSHKPFYGYMLSYCDDPEIVARMRAVIYEKMKRKAPSRKPIPVEVTDTTTGCRMQWPSVEAFCEKLGVLKNTVQKSMWKNNGTWQNYTITYLN